MPHDPLRAADSLAQLQLAESRFLEAQENRRQAILGSVQADVPLREVAEVAHCSHETIRRIVAANGAVSLEHGGDLYWLPGKTVDLLIYKLAGHALGTFAHDLAMLDAGDGWLTAAGLLADELHTGMADQDGSPVRLDETRGFALHQVLRHTQMAQPSTLAKLAESLRERYGFPPYSIRSLRRWGAVPAA